MILLVSLHSDVIHTLVKVSIGANARDSKVIMDIRIKKFKTRMTLKWRVEKCTESVKGKGIMRTRPGRW